MSDTSGPGAGKKAGKPGKAPKPPKPAVRGWDAEAAGLSRTIAFDSPDQAAKGAKRALSSFYKAGRAVEVKLDGVNVTVRVAGPIDDDLKKLAKRVVPKDPAEKAARQAARQAKADAGGEA